MRSAPQHRVKVALTCVGVLLAGVVAWTTACLDSIAPGQTPGDSLPSSDSLPRQTDSLPGLTISAPVPGAPAAGSAQRVVARAAVGASVVYVSLPPGAVPTGLRAVIRNAASGESATTGLIEGGFDPVAIPANAGDTLVVDIERSGGEGSLHALNVVRPARPPVVVRTDPPPKKIDVPLNAVMVVVFSAPIDWTTLTTGSVQLWRGSTPIPGTVRFADVAHVRAEFHPDTLLAGQTDYQLVLSQGIRDVNGVALDSAVTVPFTTGTTPPAEGLVFAMVSVGYYHTCGVTTAGAAYCWGENPGGLGDGTTTSSTTPVRVAGGLTFVAVSAGTYKTCGVTMSGAAYCWGTGGIGNPMGYSPTPVPVAGGLTFAAVSAGGGHSCGVTTTGAAYCWGDGSYGQRGDGDTSVAYQCQNPGLAVYSLACSTVPVAVAGGLTFTTAIAGYGVTCGVTTSGAPYCWGENLYGALGNGTNTGPELCEAPDYPGDPDPSDPTPCSSVPVAVAGGLTLASLKTGGPFYVCGLTPTGAAYCWGTSPNGDLTPTPASVAGGLTFATIDNGVTATCGMTTAGVAYCWGANDRGQLGNGTTTPSSVPVKVAGQP